MQNFEALAGDSHLTILLGAGASASVGLPTWDEFANRVALASGIVPSQEAGALLIEKQDPMIVLEAARQRSGANWASILSESLYGRGGMEPEVPSSLQLAAAGHFLASDGRTTLATLNFDLLLESALLTEGTPIVVASTDGGTYPDSPVVHHLHGLITRGNAVDAIVGFRDFADLVASDAPWQRNFLQSALERGPLLIAGTSYRDPDIRHWLHVIGRDTPPAHPALVTLVREGLELSRDDFDALSDALVAEWDAIGLRALTLHDLADVALVIRELRHTHEAGYATPSERAAQVWLQHRRRFGELQRSYSDQLAADTKEVADTLGVAAHRGTLWLADGSGRLARWASEGSLYSGLRHLKRVPSGHDSPWIAGEAIGAEEVKLKDVARESRVSPTWRSVLALPVFVGDGIHPDFASAVLTFGLSQSSIQVLEKQGSWQNLIQELASAWGTRLSTVAFPRMGD